MRRKMSRRTDSHSPIDFADRGLELLFPSRGNKYTGTYPEPLLEIIQQFFCPDGESRATRCYDRGLPQSHPPCPSTGQDDASHRPAHPATHAIRAPTTSSPIDTPANVTPIALDSGGSALLEGTTTSYD
ncbi:hypothetical protein GW17_00038280 [Ensete ventricosum]|nr:hypothetical protein GW17_00038280 [Ensete ventricosum]